MQETIITTLNAWMASSPLLIKLIPLLGDIFVFSYPIYLIYLYFAHTETHSWRANLWRTIAPDKTNKINALTILFATGGGIIVNYIIKFFVTEQRPYRVIDLTLNPKESLILTNIPSDSFPSDHATVGMSVAMTTLLLGYQQHNKKMIVIGRIFMSFTLIMDFSRITIGVHRPVDILGGMIVGIFIALIFTHYPIYNFLSKKIYTPIVNFQEYIFGKIIK